MTLASLTIANFSAIAHPVGHKVIQISTVFVPSITSERDKTNIYALCDDGTIWADFDQRGRPR
jgi:hypothetical protein